MVSLTVDILKNETERFRSYVTKPLELLMFIKDDLNAYINKNLNQPSRKLSRWLRRFNKNIKMKRPQCLQQEMIHGILRLVNEELKYVAHMESCRSTLVRIPCSPRNWLQAVSNV
ncbi:interferon lambda-2-like [Rhinatrema bivittatum]|uniref:interferon lambda-2-like n=1 Tax=Rhinatrema bivittatum TaxID=194408 RepID=UPI001128A7D1|nr:interferon lambda-2-like [Rhinatrema bivittatum]